MRYWTKSDLSELERIARKAKRLGKVLDMVKCGCKFNRSPHAVFHKLTSLGLMHDPSRTVTVWAESIKHAP